MCRLIRYSPVLSRINAENIIFRSTQLLCRMNCKRSETLKHSWSSLTATIGTFGMVGVSGAIDCFRFGLHCVHVNFCTLGVRSKRVESSRFSKRVERCTSFSVVSQIMSLIASFGSMRNKCCKILRNGISCGVSATWKDRQISFHWQQL